MNHSALLKASVAVARCKCPEPRTAVESLQTQHWNTAVQSSYKLPTDPDSGEARGIVVVQALSYNPEDRGFETR
jgi:hypothetical protein